MTAPLEMDWMRSLVIKPTSSANSVPGQIVAGKSDKDTENTFWLPAGVHQLIIDFDEARWMSLYDGSRRVFGMDGPHNGRIVRVVMEKAGKIVMYVSTATPDNPPLVGVTIFQVPA
ncbi:hypothetical protein [Corynebacterium sp. CCUG 51687]|uniref:hypothetical protein n=1 Tax=Corynebacterium sp. CCUG 51687 TaxID=2823897 RepID=UPI002108C25D|nr:hypothetical protein [Corynebacterium sp. CCUG 51687]MCQ4611899.1 hypothetical protein [Corynebacterium sp. CCUG 51687]